MVQGRACTRWPECNRSGQHREQEARLARPGPRPALGCNRTGPKKYIRKLCTKACGLCIFAQAGCNRAQGTALAQPPQRRRRPEPGPWPGPIGHACNPGLGFGLRDAPGPGCNRRRLDVIGARLAYLFT